MTLDPHSMEDLTLRSLVVTRRSETIYLPVWKDKNDTPYSNSAGAPLIKPVYEPHAVLCIRGTGYWSPSTFTDARVATLLDRVNDAPWHGFEAGHAWISEINSDPETQNLSNLEKVTFVVRCMQRKWNTEIADIGYYYLDGANKRSFVTADGHIFLGKLDGAGASTNGNVAMRTFDYKDEVSFGLLGF